MIAQWKWPEKYTSEYIAKNLELRHYLKLLIVTFLNCTSTIMYLGEQVHFTTYAPVLSPELSKSHPLVTIYSSMDYRLDKYHIAVSISYNTADVAANCASLAYFLFLSQQWSKMPSRQTPRTTTTGMRIISAFSWTTHIQHTCTHTHVYCSKYSKLESIHTVQTSVKNLQNSLINLTSC